MKTNKIISLKDACKRYMVELDSQKKITNSYEWYCKIARTNGNVTFTDVSGKGGSFCLMTSKKGNRWFVSKDKFERGLNKIKENTKDYIPIIVKWWK
jgi:hypothetical protein